MFEAERGFDEPKDFVAVREPGKKTRFVRSRSSPLGVHSEDFNAQHFQNPGNSRSDSKSCLTYYQLTVIHRAPFSLIITKFPLVSVYPA